MPKIDIDYSNTIIYKITCRDSTIKDVYVGHTTNFVQRKHAHKQNCINEKTQNYKCKLYQVIRNNGGWSNWNMEIINFFNCRDHYEARKKEQEYFISLNATLNSIEPFPKPKPIIIMDKNQSVKEKFYCQNCKIYCNSTKMLEMHNNTKKHKNLIMITNNSPKITQKFTCEVCDYGCGKKSDFDKHLSSNKHKSNEDCNKCNTKIAIMECENCKKIYKSRVGLWRHKKLCNIQINTTEKNKIEFKLLENNSSENIVFEPSKNEIKVLTNLLLEVMKSNSELQKQTRGMHKQTRGMHKQIMELYKQNNNM